MGFKKHWLIIENEGFELLDVINEEDSELAEKKFRETHDFRKILKNNNLHILVTKKLIE